MTQEEKAQAYDDALKRAKRYWESPRTCFDIDALTEIFPELKESEDERMLREIKRYIKEQGDKPTGLPKGTVAVSDMLAWLDKQGTSYTKRDVDDAYLKGISDAKEELEKQNKQILANSAKTCKDEQKPTDMIEPKFKVGDWVVKNDGNDCFSDGSYALQITAIDGIRYKLSNGCYLIEPFHYTYRLWSIQDARDGDVLAFYSEYKGNKMVQIGIIEKYVGKHGGCSNTFKIYVGVNWENNLQIGEYMGCSDIRPATKEQRDLLFQKIGESIYEWDADRKKLEKIHVIDEGKAEMDYCFTKMMNGEKIRPTWSKEDDIMIKVFESIIRYIVEAVDKDVLERFGTNRVELFSWLKSLRPQPKTEWSKEDESVLEDIKVTVASYWDEDTEDRILDWLKSLKERIGG